MRTSLKRLMAVILVGGLLFSKESKADPLLVPGDILFREDLPLYLANCSSGQNQNESNSRAPEISSRASSQDSSRMNAHPIFQIKIPLMDMVYVAAPVQKFLAAANSDYAQFQKRFAKRLPRLYGLDQGHLYQFDAEAKLIQTLALPFEISEGSLTVVDQPHPETQIWTSWLLITLNRKQGLSEVWVFDIDDPMKPLKVRFQLKMGWNQLTRPCGIRLSNGSRGIAIAGRHLSKTMLGLFSLDQKLLDQKQQKADLQFQLASPWPLSFIKAFDLYGQGQVDRILGVDQGGNLWSFEVSEPQARQASKLISEGMETDKNALIVIRASWPQTGFYILGHRNKELVFLYEKERGKISQIQRIPFSAHTFYYRYGRWVFVPSLMTADNYPSVLAVDFPNLRTLNREWQAKHLTMNTLSVTQSQLLWDPKRQQDTLLIVNRECQLNIYSCDTNQQQFGRIAWRSRSDAS